MQNKMKSKNVLIRKYFFTFLFFFCLSQFACSNKNKKIGKSDSTKIDYSKFLEISFLLYKNSIKVNIHNSGENEIKIVPPFYLPASNLYLYYLPIEKEDIEENWEILSGIGSSKWPEYVTITPNIEFSINIPIPDIPKSQKVRICFEILFDRSERLYKDFEVQKIFEIKN